MQKEIHAESEMDKVSDISRADDSVDFDALMLMAPDAVAYLYQDGTVIHYPVMQSDDNEYYLSHLYDGTENPAGCLFIDYKNNASFTDYNTVIYGHNMWDGSMFSSLWQYREQSYYDAHPTMQLITKNGEYSVQIISAFTAKTDESSDEYSPWTVSFETDSAYDAWLSHMIQHSEIVCDIPADTDDRVVTLSTCTPGGEDRFIVVGVLTA